MKNLYVLLLAGLLSVNSAYCEFKLLYQGDEQIQWHSLYSDGTSVIAAGYILNSDNDFYEGQILTTSDAGKNWQISKRSNIFLKSIAINSNNDLFIGGFGPGNSSYIFKSTNKGGFWQQVFTDNNYTGITHLQFFDNNTGIAAGYGNDQFLTGNIYKTTDNGNSWNSISGNIDWFNLDETFFANENTGYAVNNISGEFYGLAKTINGGKNWSEIQISEELKLDGVFFWDENEFIIGGTGGKINKTTNGGQNWLSLQSGTNLQIRGFAFDGNTGYAVGEGGLILKSTDRGKNWNKINTAYQSNFNNVKIFGDKIFVFGEKGLILIDGKLDINNETELTSDKNTVEFGKVDVGENISTKITLTNNSEKAVTISELKIDNNSDAAFSVGSILLPHILNSGESWDVTLNYMPLDNKVYSSNLIVISDATKGNLIIQLKGEGIVETELSSDKNIVEFGKLDIGENISTKISLSNNSEGSVSVSEIKFENNTDGAFSTGSILLPYIINSNDNLEFTLNFMPLENKVYSSNLIVVSDATKGDVTIQLKGEGVKPASVLAGGIEEITDVIYPNPVKDKLYFIQKYLQLFINSEVEIYDMLGNIILNGTISENAEFDVSDLAACSYILYIKCGSKSYCGKFIKE